MCGTCQVLEICIEVCFHSKQVFILVPRKKKERKNITQSDTSNWSSEIVGINCMHESCMREFQFPFHFFFWPPVTHAWPVIFSLCIIHCRAHGQSWWRKTTWGNDRAAPASFLLLPGWVPPSTFTRWMFVYSNNELEHNCETLSWVGSLGARVVEMGIHTLFPINSEVATLANLC